MLSTSISGITDNHTTMQGKCPHSTEENACQCDKPALSWRRNFSQKSTHEECNRAHRSRMHTRILTTRLRPSLVITAMVAAQGVERTLRVYRREETAPCRRQSLIQAPPVRRTECIEPAHCHTHLLSTRLAKPVSLAMMDGTSSSCDLADLLLPHRHVAAT